jgi:hypothetical protein
MVYLLLVVGKSHYHILDTPSVNIIADASDLELRVPFSLRQKTFPSLFVWFSTEPENG